MSSGDLTSEQKNALLLHYGAEEMAVTINVTGLTASGGVRLITVNMTADNLAGCLAYLALDAIEIWSSTTNDRTTAVKVGETVGRQFLHTDLPTGFNTRYYWARARNAAGTLGAFFPASTTAGVAGATVATNPGAGSVGPTELADNAITTPKIADFAVTNAKIVSLNADKINATELSAISANLGTITAGTVTGALLRTSGSSTRVQMDNSDNTLAVYTGGVLKVLMGTASITPTVAVIGHSIEALQVRGLGTTTGHGARISADGGGMGLVGVSGPGGGFAFYTEVGGYGPFTGSHDAFIAKDAPSDVGDVVVDVRVLARNGVSDTVTEVEICSSDADKRVVGVIAARVPFDPTATLAAFPPLSGAAHDPHITPVRRWLADNFDRVTINSVGEGQTSVCGLGGNIEAGDLLMTSALPGKAQKQPDDIVRSSTLGKAREAMTFDHPEQTKRISCIYMGG